MDALLTPVLMSLCFCSGILLRYSPFKNIVTPRQKKLLFGGYAAALLVNGLVILFLFERISSSIQFLEVDMLVISAVTTLLNICVIRRHIREHLFVFGLVLVCNYLILSVPVYFISGLLLNYFSLNLPVVVIGGVLLLATYRPIRWLLLRTVEPFLSLENRTYWNTVWFIPFALYFSIIFSYSNDVVSTTIPQLLSCMLTGVVMILICLGVARDHKILLAQEQNQKQLLDQKLHYIQMQQYVENVRAQHHDLKHHIAAIQRFIDTDDKQGLQEYTNQFLAQNVTDVLIPYTGNAAADGVVYRYMQLAQQNDVDFHYTGIIYSNGISDMDLCVLLGNALDNALTGCLTIPENRSISLVSKKEDGLLSIMVHNTFDGKIEQTGTTFLSRKRDRVPGVGMQSMQTICDRYNGILQTSWNESSFSILFLLPIQ